MPPLSRVLPAIAFLLALGSCKSITDALNASTASNLKTYPPIWINASWQGGRTGTPLQVKSVIPPTLTGAYCPPNAIDMENHLQTSQYYARGWENSLTITNNC